MHYTAISPKRLAAVRVRWHPTAGPPSGRPTAAQKGRPKACWWLRITCPSSHRHRSAGQWLEHRVVNCGQFFLKPTY